MEYQKRSAPAANTQRPPGLDDRRPSGQVSVAAERFEDNRPAIDWQPDRDLADWLDDLCRAHGPDGIAVLRRHGLEAARLAGRAGVDQRGHITSPAFDPLDQTLVDIVTVNVDNEVGYATLTGLATFLGEGPLLDEIELQPSPIDWLQAGATGICVINWEVARPYLTGSPPLRLICRDRQHVAQVKHNLWGVLPRLLVAAPNRMAA